MAEAQRVGVDEEKRKTFGGLNVPVILHTGMLTNPQDLPKTLNVSIKKTMLGQEHVSKCRKTGMK